MAHAHLGDRHVKIEVKTEDCPCEENDEYAERRVFEISHLDFHASKLDPPSDSRIHRRRFESDCLPIRRLDVLEMVHRGIIVLIDGLTELNEWIAYEEVSDMGCEPVIEP